MTARNITLVTLLAGAVILTACALRLEARHPRDDSALAFAFILAAGSAAIASVVALRAIGAL